MRNRNKQTHTTETATKTTTSISEYKKHNRKNNQKNNNIINYHLRLLPIEIELPKNIRWHAHSDRNDHAENRIIFIYSSFVAVWSQSKVQCCAESRNNSRYMHTMTMLRCLNRFSLILLPISLPSFEFFCTGNYTTWFWLCGTATNEITPQYYYENKAFNTFFDHLNWKKEAKPNRISLGKTRNVLIECNKTCARFSGILANHPNSSQIYQPLASCASVFSIKFSHSAPQMKKVRLRNASMIFFYFC